MADKKVFVDLMSQDDILINISSQVAQFNKVKSDDEKRVIGDELIGIVRKQDSTLSDETWEALQDVTLLKKVVKDLAKEVKKLEKKLRKQEGADKRRAQEESALAERMPLVSWEAMRTGTEAFGVSPLHMSADTKYAPELLTLTKLLKGTADGSLFDTQVVIRGRVHVSRAVGKQCFLLIRVEEASLQIIVSVDETHSEGLLHFCRAVPKESIVDFYGLLRASPEPVESASVKNAELHVDRAYAISVSEKPTPVNVQDCMLPEEKLKEMEGFAGVGQAIRLDYRYLDLRAPAHVAILKIQSAIGLLFREHLHQEGFTEIHTPKLIATASEGGSNVFQLDYFGRPAFLAQSPQLYKQMAIQSDLKRVFEVGPVFRAENSNTHRHLCEFVGLDLEMRIDHHYHEVLRCLDGLFVSIFEGLKTRFAQELEVIGQQYPFEPLVYREAGKNLILTYPVAMQMLRDAGEDVSDSEDMTTSQEKHLGRLVKEKYNTDFFILDKFPMTVRPFYTMPDPTNPLSSNSYDLFIRGEEISSGAQRIHDAEFLLKKAEEKGVSMEPIMDYVNSFRYGGWPHGGAGIGLERVVMLYLGIRNVRRVTMFPRTPDRLTP